MPANVNVNQLADRYVALWNEHDPDVRHKLVDELWAEDGIYHNRLFVVQGRQMVEFAVGRGHDEYFSKGFCFKSQNDAYGHHNGMRFSWVMVATATGEVDTFGQDFLLLDDDGRIRVDYQFAMKRPSV
jgi:hypothetical protein